MKFAAILFLAAAGLYAIGDAVLAPTPVHVSDVDNQQRLVSIEHARETIENLEQELAKSNLAIERMKEAAKGAR